jgi:hypothetical protein
MTLCMLCGATAASNEAGLCAEHARLVVDLRETLPLTAAGLRAGWRRDPEPEPRPS